MQTGTVLVAILFALTSFPFLGHGKAQESQQPGGSAVPQQTSPATAQSESGTAASTPSSSAAPEMRPVQAELVSKLDSKTAKTGDDIVVETKSAVTTAEGKQIPKGTKVHGKIVGVQAAAAGKNSEVAVQFDHAELSGGQSIPIRSEIQSIGSAVPGSSSADSAMSAPSTPAPATSSGAVGNSPAGAAQAPSGMEHGPGSPAASPGPEGNTASASSAPPAGTVVATTGGIAIKTTSVPGVLLANNQPGQQDPRMANASSVLLGARKDVQLQGGTPMVLGVSSSSPGVGTGSK